MTDFTLKSDWKRCPHCNGWVLNHPNRHGPGHVCVPLREK